MSAKTLEERLHALEKTVEALCVDRLGHLDMCQKERIANVARKAERAQRVGKLELQIKQLQEELADLQGGIL